MRRPVPVDNNGTTQFPYHGPGLNPQRTEITPAQAAILEQLGIDPPPRIYQLTPAAAR